MEKFNSIGDVLKDERCAYFVEKQLTEIRFKRKHPETGLRFKRSAVDTLAEKGLFNTKQFINQYIGIVGKKTDLSARERELITEIMRKAITDTINENI